MSDTETFHATWPILIICIKFIKRVFTYFEYLMIKLVKVRSIIYLFLENIYKIKIIYIVLNLLIIPFTIYYVNNIFTSNPTIEIRNDIINILNIITN